MDWRNELQNLLGPDKVSTNAEFRAQYASDHTEDLRHVPDCVCLPERTEDVSRILAFCHAQGIPVTPRGAGTGLSGGSLPVQGGVSLSMERMNRILEIDEQNFQATVEAGVINEVFQQAVAEKGLFYPPDPASKGSCFLGGNIAHSSGGPRAVKYGTTKDFVLNLQVVLADGTVIWTGANTLKNSTGYNLTQLMIGSEGTLGVVTRIVFRLLPLPKHTMLMLASFADAQQACQAVVDILHTGHDPSALELMERSAFDLINAHHPQLRFETKTGIDAYLLIEVDGNDPDRILDSCEQIHGALEAGGSEEVLFADTAAQKEHFWKLRRSISEMVKSHSIYKEEDTVVQRAHLPKLLAGVKAIGKEFGFESVCYGHAGDGNLHVNILKGAMNDADWNGAHLEEGIRRIFRLCKELGGTISGEHGIGLVQRKYMREVMPEYQLELMRGIKKTFDPKGILNPGKIF